MTVPEEVIRELATAFGLSEDNVDVDESESMPEPDLETDLDLDPEIDLEIDLELDPTAPVAQVITIDDEEFADPLYLDQLGPEQSAEMQRGLAGMDLAGMDLAGGTEAGSGSLDRVVIVDGGELDAMVPGASGRDGPGRMEPKLRARRISVRRAKGRRRLRWVAIGGGLLLGTIAVLAILGSPLFSIAEDDVVVTGAVYTDRIRLEEIISEAVGSTTLLLNTGGIEREIEEIAWVDMARVRTSFPTGLRIEIRERSPLATYQGSDGLFRVIDKEGRVLDVIEGQPIAYVLLFGLEELVLQPGQFTPPGPVGAAQLVQALTATVRGRAQAIEVDPNGEDLRLYLHRDALYGDQDASEEEPEEDPLTAARIEVRFGAASELLLKLVRLETVLPVALTEEVTFIDVSTATVTVR
jgi:cell division protein FtsQ